MKNKSFGFYSLSAFMLLFPFFVGGYYSFYQAFGGIVLTVLLLVSMMKNKELKIQIGISAITIAIITIISLVVKFWALDKSMSIYGFVRMLMVALFALNLWQIDKDERQDILHIVPYSATLMTIISFSLGQIDKLHYRFFDYVDDLHGTFEYANSYAQFVLISLIICIVKPHKKDWTLGIDIICGIISAIGIYLSGSRAVWLVTAGMIGVIAFFFIINRINAKRAKIGFIGILVIIGAAIAIILYKAGYIEKIYNYITTDGSLIDRYLFYKDSLKYSLHHPFGKGEYAFYYGQPQFQSAFYYAIDVHNDYLQIMVEIGILPALLFVGMLGYNLFCKNNSNTQRAVLLAIMIHSLVDYDLKFTAIWLILVLCLEFDKEKVLQVQGALMPILLCAGIIIFNGVLGLSSYYNHAGRHDKSLYYYKNTSSMIMMLKSTNDQDTGYRLANDILKKNNSIFEANHVLANIYEANEMYDEAIEQMELVLQKDPRTMDNYRDYIDLCVKAEEFYKDNSAKENEIAKKIKSVPETIKKLKDNTPEYAIKYARKQDFNLGKEYIEIVEKY